MQYRRRMTNHMQEPLDGPKHRRRRKWIIALSVPGYVAFVTFALMASTQRILSDLSDAWLIPSMFIGLISVASWGFAPILTVIALVVFLIDVWRHRRPRRERVFLTLLLIGSPVAWFLSNLINDAFHLLR
jgi:hypothetical protein